MSEQLMLPVIDSMETRFTGHVRKYGLSPNCLLVVAGYNEPLHFVTYKETEEGLVFTLRTWTPNWTLKGELVEVKAGTILGIHAAMFY